MEGRRSGRRKANLPHWAFKRWGFTCLFWAIRSKGLAAVAPSSSSMPGFAYKLAWQKLAWQKSKPAKYIAVVCDTLVKVQWQVAAMEAVRKLSDCETDGKPCHEHPNCLIYESLGESPFASVIHSGGHKFFSDAPRLIVKLF